MTKGFPRWIRKDSEACPDARSTAAIWAALNNAPLSMPTTSQDVSGARPNSQAVGSRSTR